MDEHEVDERRESWDTIRDEVRDAVRKWECTERRYQWSIGTLVAALMFVLGAQCQGERLATTVVRNEARVTAVETQMVEIKSQLTWIVSNIATKEDVRAAISGQNRTP